MGIGNREKKRTHARPRGHALTRAQQPLAHRQRGAVRLSQIRPRPYRGYLPASVPRSIPLPRPQSYRSMTDARLVLVLVRARSVRSGRPWPLMLLATLGLVRLPHRPVRGRQWVFSAHLRTTRAVSRLPAKRNLLLTRRWQNRWRFRWGFRWRRRVERCARMSRARVCHQRQFRKSPKG